MLFYAIAQVLISCLLYVLVLHVYCCRSLLCLAAIVLNIVACMFKLCLSFVIAHVVLRIVYYFESLMYGLPVGRGFGR